ncbi:hypothetical protein AB0G79_17350 [Streptomyces sp. NPDC020807]|uniref:hypothetical protein n=1 Tax=Streptomyces sp. NPDC020807 TaxID=3155119 RepID=UPI00340440B0
MPTSRVRLLLWSGAVAAAGGAVLCVLGWYGISGERYVERQLPYLASCVVPGAALLVSGAVLVAAALTSPVPPPAPEPPPVEEWRGTPPPSSTGPPLHLPGGTLAHRPDCPLVVGRPEAREVEDPPPTSLSPCPVCEPWPP